MTWTYYYLYVMLDVYSRYVVGWLLANRESAGLAQELTAAAYSKQQVEPGQLTIHADRGSAMIAKSHEPVDERPGRQQEPQSAPCLG